jgi:hypothetical protein
LLPASLAGGKAGIPEYDAREGPRIFLCGRPQPRGHDEENGMEKSRALTMQEGIFGLVVAGRVEAGGCW